MMIKKVILQKIDMMKQKKKKEIIMKITYQKYIKIIKIKLKVINPL